MAGRGPAPKDPSRRARRNADPIPIRVIQTTPVEQPELIEILGDVNPATSEPWQPATLRLWKELCEFPSTDLLQPAQWSLLARAMMLDDAFVAGNTKAATEARLQFQKFGIAPDDVARLRITFAQADEAEDKRRTPAGSAKDRRGGLKALPDADAG